MTDPIVVTPEMRRAVYQADCDAQGHLFNFGKLVTNTGTGQSIVGAPQPDEIAHLSCSRCTKIWLLVETPGEDYADAVAQLQLLAKDPADVKPAPRPPEPDPTPAPAPDPTPVPPPADPTPATPTPDATPPAV